MPNDATVTVTVKLFGGLRELVGESSITISLRIDATLADLLSKLRQDFPKLYEKLQPGLTKGYLNALLDGRNVRSLDGFDTVLPSGSAVAFLPPVGGG